MRHFPTVPFAFCLAAHFLFLALASSLHTSQLFLGHYDAQITDKTPLHPSFDSFVDRLMQEWHIPGLAIAVVHENKTWSKGYGYATLPDVPFTPHTLYQVASTTKSFTASLTALLVQDQDEFRHVEWDTPLHSLVGNDFVLKDDYLTTHVSLLDALSHRTGMPRHDAVWYDRGLDAKSQTYLMRHLETSASFRTVFQYCNLFFTAVSHVLQSVTGKPQADLLREWIFEPLGMNESYYSREDAANCIYRNERVFGHTGGISGYASSFKFLPDRKFGFVMIQNSMSTAFEAMGWRLIDEFLGGPQDEFYDMNKTQSDLTRIREDKLKALPSKLYPNVPSEPVQPQLPLQDYTGIYTNAAYGNFSISLEAPSELLDKSRVGEVDAEDLLLYAKSKGGNVLFTFRHVSAEHWLLEMRYVIYDSKMADDYMKARFEVRADGIVHRLGVVIEAAVPGDKAWAWFDRVDG
ncbi:beta-lactamase/transpeptidase-like protein, partial [Aureobasidium melanogenum]